MSAVFITATGTDIGKTYLACALIRHLKAHNRTVEAMKPVATGFDPARPEQSDTGLLLAALGLPLTRDNIASITPWHFAAPLSPERAARREGRELDYDRLVEWSRQSVLNHQGTLLFEGIGGVMVPLDARHTVLDWMEAVAAPVLLIAGSYLGSISHTLTAIEALRQRQIPVLAIVVNESEAATVSVQDTMDSIALFARETPILELTRKSSSVTNKTIERICELLDGVRHF